MKARYFLLLLIILGPWLTSVCTLKPDSAEFEEILITAAAAGDAPDVAYVDNLQMAAYADQGWLKPVPDVIEREAFYPATIEALRWQGTLYAVPHDAQSIALVVNQELFDEVGLEPPESWGEFDEAARALWNPEAGVFGLGMTAGFWSFLPFFYQAGGRLVDEDGWLALDTEQAQLALEFYARPSVEEYALMVPGEGFEQGAYSGLLDAFAEGRIAMFVGGPGMYNGVLQRMGLDPAKQTTVRVLELPAGPAGRATIAFTRGLGLFGQPGENPSPAAVEFLAYATGPEGLAFWIGDSGTPPDYVPARPGLADQWLERHPGTKAFVVGLEYAQNYQPDDVPGAAYAEFYEMASRILPQALTGQLPVSDVLKSLQEEGNEILRNYR